MGCYYFEHFNQLTQLLHKTKHSCMKFVLFISVGKLTVKQNRQVALLAGVGPYTKLSKAFHA
jgi:formate hydrogenlyase subunit 3/multisubunit Na+/H+ antiporter MnhD subunit